MELEISGSLLQERRPAWQYPVPAYDTDRLNLRHVAIAVTFLGPWRDPVRNIWRVKFGMIAWALQNIPFFWQIADRSFGIPGIIPLWVIHRDILRISDNL